jgi:hypothetical protein
MLESKIAYFAPNNFGYKGYAMIGPLLLFYERLVISNPSGNLLLHSLRDERKTTLTEDEIRRYIMSGIIVPTGFQTFFDPKIRQQEYAPELRPATILDEEIIEHPDIKQIRVVLPDDYKQLSSSTEAIQICQSKPNLKNQLSYIFDHQQSEIPARYTALRSEENAFPRSLRSSLPDLRPAEMFPYMFIYDQLNNRFAISEFERRWNVSAAHALHNDYQFLYTATDRVLSGFTVNKKNEMDDVSIVGEALRESIGRLKIDRLSSDIIDEFRSIHRESFLAFIHNAMKQLEAETDLEKKRSRVRFLIKQQFDRLQWHLSISPETLLGVLPQIVKLNLPSIPSSTYSRRTYSLLYRPLQKSKRWLFHFLNPIEF